MFGECVVNKWFSDTWSKKRPIDNKNAQIWHDSIDFVPIEVYNLNLGILCIFEWIERSNMEYLIITQVAEKWGIKQRRIRVLCTENRIVGAQKVGSVWLIPSDVEKPKDERIKSGKYCKLPDDTK